MYIMPLSIKMRVDNILYDQIETEDINEGDLVFDTHDNTYGYIDMKKGDKVAVRHD